MEALIDHIEGSVDERFTAALFYSLLPRSFGNQFEDVVQIRNPRRHFQVIDAASWPRRNARLGEQCVYVVIDLCLLILCSRTLMRVCPAGCRIMAVCLGSLHPSWHPSTPAGGPNRWEEDPHGGIWLHEHLGALSSAGGRIADPPIVLDHLVALPWGSIMPPKWSFMLALRSRGLFCSANTSSRLVACSCSTGETMPLESQGWSLHWSAGHSTTVASPEGRIATSVEFLDRVAGLLGLEIVEIEAPDLWHGSRTANESHL